MIADAVAVGLAACALLAVRALREGPRAWVAWLERGVGDGAVVLGGLGVQGWGVPAARWLWVAALSGASLPGFAAPAWVGAALVLVVTDAAWWWQHRWLHGRGWALHAVHHEASAMDALDNQVEILDRSGQVLQSVSGSKQVVAAAILDWIERRLIG